MKSTDLLRNGRPDPTFGIGPVGQEESEASDRGVINKTMDRSDLDLPASRRIVNELNDLIRLLATKRLLASSWYGRFSLPDDPGSPERANRGFGYAPLAGAADDAHFPWFLYWEIVWIVLHAEFRRGQTLLDLGGSSSLFSYYLASKGIHVTTVDLQSDLVENAERTARATGWPLRNHMMDMRALRFDSQFDHVTSICVYEHLPLEDRLQVNSQVGKLLRDGGRFSITFDYRNPSKAVQINTPQDVAEQFVSATGLSVRGNSTLFDSGRSYLLHPFYHPRTSLAYRQERVRRGEFAAHELQSPVSQNQYTFAALFLERS